MWSVVWLAPRVSLNLACVAVALNVGCGEYDADKDSQIPGEPLGSYAVKGTVSRDTCGVELLGAPDPWTFELRLSRFEEDLYWLNGREAIVGRVGSDDNFTFDTRLRINLGDSTTTPASCIVWRRDLARGTLHFTDDEVSSLDGSLGYHYDTPTAEECLGIIGVYGGVASLPCDLEYRITGTRVADVDE